MLIAVIKDLNIAIIKIIAPKVIGFLVRIRTIIIIRKNREMDNR